MMSEPKRLHPAGMLFNIIQAIRHSVFGFLPLVIIAVGNDAWFYVILGASILICLIILFSVLSWLRYTYQLEEDQIRIEQGILIRKKRTISKHRIQSIDLSQNIIHRIFGLTKVQIETAGSDHRIDAALSAVTMADGKMLHDQLKSKKQVTETDVNGEEQELKEEVHEQDYPQKKITPKALFVAGSTSGSFGIILGLAGLVFSELETFIPDRFYNQATEWVFSQAVQVLIALAVIVLILLWVLGILSTIIQYWNFTITRYDKELFITRGLLEKKQSTIPLKRIQAVGIKETIIRQPIGLASVYVEIASGEIGQNQEMHTLIFPIMRKKHIASFLKDILPEYRYQPEGLVKLPTKAIPYYIIRSVIIPLIATVVVAVQFTEFTWIPGIVMLLSCIYGYFQYKTTGYLIQDKQLLVQSRTISKDTALVPHKRLQSLQKKQHILHRKQGLATLDTAILNKFVGRHFIVRELNVEDVDQIADWYSYRKKPLS
ncbi:PH domain-containing protein [Gracilibacillus thailandensis]|uniref:PH domain-containing protein n=2 Tax=Gracilibacillus thailandensis TaxID=563735 RepID=A0A6N7QXC5_9BACI|nr:PH domain-containing protein [Gracilibacillus thailandensis]MRI65802.1 PH domain-containing protein [Gracilibacillus thailandensis]